MAREHRADHRPVHPGRRLSSYPIAAVAEGPWPARLGLGPIPAGGEDPAAIAAWGTSTVLGLTTAQEAERHGWSDLADRLAAVGITWLNAPIEDFMVPDAAFERAWPALRDRLIAVLDGGGRILVHCRGGRGRSGTVVAALLVAGGLPADEAVRAVRKARPGAIETPDQEAWIRQLTAGPQGRTR
ncbi:dual specificity protein phosphatase family protein [Thalassobaculum sp.]|uniref:phosphatase domain-containing protein n=1 Tax=Thalassobaculum sp. TaxID=2022740 RepID=UPI0032EBC94F